MEQEQKPKSSPRDVFLHLLSIVALYAAATAFLTLAFQLINLWFPDILEMRGYYAYAGARLPAGQAGSTLRWALASFVIIFPVYFFTARFLRREYEALPEKRELKVRKWLVSFTLFAVAVTLIADLVSLLSHFLEGELTTRFVLKVLVVAFVAGAIGVYYLWILKGRTVTPGAKATASGILLITLAGVVVGFFYAGSPAEERLRRIDMQRVSDLQTLQSEVVSYWQAKEKLPGNLAELTDDIRGYGIPNDPETGTPYEYRAMGALAFELCAAFARASLPDRQAGEGMMAGEMPMRIAKPYYGGIAENWDHEMGRHCFARTIDPDIYRPLPR